MLTPTLLLLLGIAVVVAGVLLFWPPSGLWWRWRRGRVASERALVEDALKHLHNCEYGAFEATLESVAGALGIDRGRAADVLERLQREGLARGETGRWALSSEGRAYALRVLRTHRLWERFFSDETGIPAPEWHDEAEIREHQTTSEETEALSAQLGHPRFDPHGDPIPTSEGGLPDRLPGRPLARLPVGAVGEIVHIEDEPTAVYSQLVAEGLHPGTRVRLLEVSPEQVRFESDAGEHVVAPVVAGNLSVLEWPEAELPEPRRTLSTLAPSETAVVRGLAPAVQGVQRRRLLDLGLVPGTRVEVVRVAPGGDPTAYRIRGAVIALRREQAERVYLERPESAGEAA